MAEKSIVVAYILWIILGEFGLHRLYLGDMFGFGIYLILWVVSILLLVIGVGILTFLGIAILWIVDICLIPGLVERANKGQQQTVVVVQQTVQQQPQYVQQQPQYVQQQPQYVQQPQYGEQQPQYVQQPQQYQQQ